MEDFMKQQSEQKSEQQSARMLEIFFRALRGEKFQLRDLLWNTKYLQRASVVI